MRFSRLLLFLLLLTSTLSAYSQVTSTGCSGIADYPNTDASDSMYVFYNGQLGDLTATAPGGQAPFTFNWSYYDLQTFSWSPYFSETDNSSSTIEDLNPAAYTVTIIDNGGNTVFCDIAWIALAEVGESYGGGVDVLPIEPSCTVVELHGTIEPFESTGFSILPPNPMFVDGNTEIQVCFSGTHSWVSDLGFYLVGPASCGSPTILLSPNPGSIGQGLACNNGDNITNLCFSTESSNNLDVCAGAPFTLTGTYGTYGPSATPITWSALNGCDATNAGWSVQIYDCIALDTGFLTDATITFTGDDNCGDPQTVTYTTPPGFSSFIADNSCSPQTASIFSVPAPGAASELQCETGFIWTSEPYVYIPNATTALDISISLPFVDSLNVPLNPQPDMVLFTLTYTNECWGEVDTTYNGCFPGGGTGPMSDTEPFYFIYPTPSNIEPAGPYCESDGNTQLFANPPGGTWSGPGITNNALGTFSPSIAGDGYHIITYDPGIECVYSSSIEIQVYPFDYINMYQLPPFCVDDAAVYLEGYSSGGFPLYWTGNGITDPFGGLFDPSVAGPGTHMITAESEGWCYAQESIFLTVNPLPNVSAGPDQLVCNNGTTTLNASGADYYYSWYPIDNLSDPGIANPVCTLINDITYTVTGTDINGCSASDDVYLNLVAAPELEVNTVPMVCPGDVIDLIATGTDGSAFSWSPSTNVANPNAGVTTATPEVTTTYTVVLTDECEQELSAEVLVEVEAPVSIDFGASNYSICEGESITFEAIINGDYTSLQWTTQNGTIDPAEENNSSITVNDEGSYTLTATTTLGCTYAETILLDVIPLPNVNLAGPIFLCPGTEATIDAGNWDAVQWSGNETTASITVNASGTYSVTATENGCSSSDSVIVEMIDMPVIELGPDLELCEGEAIELNVGVNATWSTSTYGESILVSVAGTYSVFYSDGPCSVFDSIQVTVLPLPVAYLGPDQVACINEGTWISAFDNANSEYAWSTGETTSSIQVMEPGIYSVETSNQCGEIGDEIEVFFEDCTFEIFIPNTFTPDHDGINDVWKISTYRVKTMALKVFNRWGDVLFTTNDPTEPWTGEAFDGSVYVPDGSYSYYLTYESEEGEKGERTGHVNIIR